MLLTGDTVACTPDEHWVSFMRSFPNKLPLSAAVVEKVAGRVLALDFDRLYDNFVEGWPATPRPGYAARPTATSPGSAATSTN